VRRGDAELHPAAEGRAGGAEAADCGNFGVVGQFEPINID
jgi:hypothetical protein